MKSAKLRIPPPRHPAPRKAGTQSRTYRAEVAVGDVISFDPTGEELRVTKIERDRITFEKVP